MPVSLHKLEQSAPALVSLYKTAAVSLQKHGLHGQRAAVYLVVDYSGSMREYYKDGSVQASPTGSSGCRPISTTTASCPSCSSRPTSTRSPTSRWRTTAAG
jgi:hypothetical protein